MTAQGSVRRVAILGAGPASRPSGTALAQRAARAGFHATLEDIFPANLRRAGLHAPAQNIHYASSIEDAVREADLVIDTVPDELESKLEILSLLDRMAPPATLFLTPTEALSIADLASCTYRPGQCFGLRFPAGLPDEQQPFPITLAHAPSAISSSIAGARSFLEAIGGAVTLVEDQRQL